MFNKEVTVEKIGEYLVRYGWTNFQVVPEPGEKEGLILTGWGLGGGEDHKVMIDPMVERGALNFRVRQVVQAPPDSTAGDRLNGLLFAIGGLNYKMLLGSFGFDPSDGEVVLKIALPVKGGDLDYDDFKRVLDVLVAEVEVQGPKLKAILEGETTAQEVIAAHA
jgi:hypothetical protein